MFSSKVITSIVGIVFSTLVHASFITTWETNQTNQEIEIGVSFATQESSEFMLVDWGDGSEKEKITTVDTFPKHTYTDANKTYTVKITTGNDEVTLLEDTNPKLVLRLGESDSKDFVVSIDAWYDVDSFTPSLSQPTAEKPVKFLSLDRAFRNCTNLDYKATDAPDLSNITSIASMFSGIGTISGNISNWDTSNIKDMNNMFANMKNFSQDISGWNVSSVEDFSNMFSRVDSLNTSVKLWNISSAKNLSGMFSYSSFDEDLSIWNIANEMNMEDIFSNTFLSKANLFSILESWSAQGAKNIVIDIGLKPTVYKLQNNESERIITIEDRNVSIEKDTAYYSDYNYTELAPFLKTMVTDLNWSISENSREFSFLELINIPAMNIVEEFESFTQRILTQESVDDRNNTRTVTYSADINDTSLLDYNLNENLFSFVAKKDAYGIARMRYTLSDGYFQESGFFDINISNSDDSPVIDTNITIQDKNITLYYDSNINTYTLKGIDEGSEAFSFDINSTDVDGDEIRYSIESYDSRLLEASIDSNGHVTLTPQAGASGRVKVNIKAEANSKFTTQSYFIELQAKNDSPTFSESTIQNLRLEEDSGTRTLDINISDLDGDDLTLSIESNNTLLLNASTSWDGILSQADYASSSLDFNITTVKDAFGIARIKLSLSDSQSVVERFFDVNVTSVYDPFRLADIADKIKEKNFESFSEVLDIEDFDVKGNLLYTLKYDTQKLRLSMDEVTKTLSVDSIRDVTGTFKVSIEVRDQNTTQKQTFNIAVLDTQNENLPSFVQNDLNKSYISHFSSSIHAKDGAQNAITDGISKLYFSNAEVSMNILGKVSANVSSLVMSSEFNTTDTLLYKKDSEVEVRTFIKNTKLLMQENNTLLVETEKANINSRLLAADVKVKDNGGVDIYSGSEEEGEFFIRAFTQLLQDGSIHSKFVKVLKTDKSSLSEIEGANFFEVSSSTNNVEIKNIENTLIIESTISLDENLRIY